jgi:hypothetical protein
MSAEEEESKSAEETSEQVSDMLDNDDGFVPERLSHNSASGFEVVNSFNLTKRTAKIFI